MRLPRLAQIPPVFLFLLSGIACACNSSAPAPSPAPAASAAKPAAQPAPLEYLERSSGGARANEPLPLLVAMHGLGDRPEAFGELYAGFAGKARIVLLRAPDPWGDGFSWFPFRANDGDELRSRGIATAAERVVTMLGVLEARHPSKGKPIVTGFSQGGMLSFAIAARHPGRVRAALPIGGVLPPPLWPGLDAGRPAVRIIALHGETDDLVPLAPTRAGVDALRARGFDARLETFPAVGHRIPAPLRTRYFELLREELERP
ncbi:MAG: alpha/beta fold hydrolase [Myxococcales bacterium]|nr:alpha/beta fold hydrolase [Sorangiineae bacterium PRO1]MCL4755139.1 alpha/beta fold hydrolase [Myxococcales bacterium]